MTDEPKTCATRAAWREACAARYRWAGVKPAHADEFAAGTLATVLDDEGIADDSAGHVADPVEEADAEMSCWEDDGE